MFRVNREKENQKGFTLIELMIVIAIIAILAAMAIPQFSSYKAKGYNAAAQSDLRVFKTDIEAYHAEWQEFIN